MPINTNPNFEELSAWLNENLTDKNRIKACCEQVKNVPENKGIYFWFMHPDGYEALSNFVAIQTINPRYTKEINGEKYDLVYLGSAGTGKKGNSNLKERLRWHLCQKHSEKTICHKNSVLSTLRKGISSLLSDDLIEIATEKKLNDFLCQNMLVCWVAYKEAETIYIDSDEEKLIKIVKPLLNIKNNPNTKADAIENHSKVYRRRRNLVSENTKKRLGCNGEDENVMKKQNPTEFAVSYEERVIVDYEHCVEYTLQQGEDIAKVTRGIEGLPLGKCKVEIWDSNNCNIQFKKWARVTGRNEDGQNVYTYFSNTSSGNTKRRSLIVSQWMVDNKIEEITVRVCPIILKKIY